MSSPANPPTERLALAIGLALICYLCFTGIDSSAKWLGRAGLPTMEIVFVRYAVHFGLAVLVFLPRRGMALVRTARPGIQILRALFLAVSTVLNFIAVQFLPLTVTASISFTAPLILCALSMPLLGEMVGWRRWTAVIVGFIGVIVIVRPGTAAFQPAVLLSLANALMTALFFVTTKRLAGVDSAATQQFYAAMIATMGIAPFALSSGWVWPQHGVDWFFFCLIGVAALAGHIAFSTALRFARASVLAPFAYFQIVYMTVSSWLLFAEPPDVWIYVGAPIVIASGLYIWLRERKLAQPLKPVVAID
jgi:drug/metabolite transporter (DMT)-like permease